MSFSLRPIEANDTEVVQSIVASVRAEFAGVEQKPAARAKNEKDDSLCDIEEAGERYLASRGMFYVMSDRNRIIGTGALRRFSDEIGELRHLCFLRPYRGRGLGEEMLISLLEFARENDYQFVRLTVLKNQFEAQKLFLKLGFQESGRPNKETGELLFELDLNRKSRKIS